MPGRAFGMHIDVRDRVSPQMRKLSHKFADDVDEFMRREVQKLRKYMHTRKYPPRSGKPYQFVSEKQRRFVMALIAAGLVPYKRSGRYASSWAVVKSRKGTYQLVNRASVAGHAYPAYVGGDFVGAHQAAYHRGNWPLAKKQIDSQLPNLRRNAEKELQRQASKITG